MMIELVIRAAISVALVLGALVLYSLIVADIIEIIKELKRKK